jgi:hypothetical protein
MLEQLKLLVIVFVRVIHHLGKHLKNLLILIPSETILVIVGVELTEQVSVLEALTSHIAFQMLYVEQNEVSVS